MSRNGSESIPELESLRLSKQISQNGIDAALPEHDLDAFNDAELIHHPYAMKQVGFVRQSPPWALQ